MSGDHHKENDNKKPEHKPEHKARGTAKDHGNIGQHRDKGAGIDPRNNTDK